MKKDMKTLLWKYRAAQIPVIQEAHMEMGQAKVKMKLCHLKESYKISGWNKLV